MYTTCRTLYPSLQIIVVAEDFDRSMSQFLPATLPSIVHDRDPPSASKTLSWTN